MREQRQRIARWGTLEASLVDNRFTSTFRARFLLTSEPVGPLIFAIVQTSRRKVMVIAVTRLIVPYVFIFARLCECGILRVSRHRCEVLVHLPRPGFFFWSDAKTQMSEPLNWRWLNGNVTCSVLSSTPRGFVRSQCWYLCGRARHVGSFTEPSNGCRLDFRWCVN